MTKSITDLPKPSGKDTLNLALLSSGILSSLWYLALNLLIPTRYEGYDLSSFTVSELSAIGAPTRGLWVSLVTVYTILFAAFGWGVVRSSDGSRHLRTTGILIIAYSIFNVYWPPMHQRGVEPTLTDTLHIVWAAITVFTMIVIMVFGAAALGKSFRMYTITSIALHLLFGLLTSLEAPNIATNTPTPHIGVWERINIAIFMLWVAVFATVLMRHTKQSHPDRKQSVAHNKQGIQ